MGGGEGACRLYQREGVFYSQLQCIASHIYASPQIVKLYLYNNEHALALSNHNSHMRKFADFSRGWGIGEETFEFWSWLARQWVSPS